MVKLAIYVSEDCWTCKEARQIVADVGADFPDVNIEILDVESNERPEIVFAVPTYMLNDRVISLGNPSRQELSRKLAAAQLNSDG